MNSYIKIKMEFQEVLDKRTSVKKFSSKKPSIELIMKAIFSANMAPSSGNLNVLRYIIVEESKIIGKIADACQQEFIREAPYVVIVCSDLSQLKRMYDIRAEKYLRHNAGAAVENFLLKITELGLGSCWTGAFSESILKNHLNIPENVNIEVILPVGYEVGKVKTRQRYKQNLINRVFSNSWGNKYRPFTKVRREDV